MSTQVERDENQPKVDYVIKIAAGNDEYAADYLRMISRITRLIDDVYDNDHQITREEYLKVLEYLFVRLPSNPFFNEYRDTLLSQHISMYNAWMAANKAESGDNTDKVYAHVWRDTCNELVPIVTLLTQGFDQMTLVSEKMRPLFKKTLGG